VGLLILRLVACSSIIARVLAGLRTGEAAQPAIPELAAILVSVFLAVGLWTPVSGCPVAAFALWDLISNPGEYWSSTLLAAMGVALAMIGPGVWSLDARIFGWRRIVLRDR
jgi:uncharacterized membrane protein YphA (DoxX/SURF4 family)